jgi:hypothetical protein
MPMIVVACIGAPVVALTFGFVLSRRDIQQRAHGLCFVF